MLIDHPALRAISPVTALLAAFSGKSPTHVRAAPGIYEIGHFGSSSWPEGFEQYPDDLSVQCYGVCDSVEQLLEKCPELRTSTRKFAVSVHFLEKSKEPPEGGWRWRKWGPYIGTQTPTCEYLHDEPLIEHVYVYHIYELLPEDAARP